MTYLKKDCCGCRALQEGKCVLGYSVLVEVPEEHRHQAFYVPTEPCSKPRTYERLNELLSEVEARNG